MKNKKMIKQKEEKILTYLQWIFIKKDKKKN